ncbi:MAG: hypothetical protein ABGY72_21110 [bacterium]
MRTDTAFRAAALIGVRPVLVVDGVFGMFVGVPVVFLPSALAAFCRASTSRWSCAIWVCLAAMAAVIWLSIVEDAMRIALLHVVSLGSWWSLR